MIGFFRKPFALCLLIPGTAVAETLNIPLALRAPSIGRVSGLDHTPIAPSVSNHASSFGAPAVQGPVLTSSIPHVTLSSGTFSSATVALSSITSEIPAAAQLLARVSIPLATGPSVHTAGPAAPLTQFQPSHSESSYQPTHSENSYPLANCHPSSQCDNGIYHQVVCAPIPYHAPCNSLNWTPTLCQPQGGGTTGNSGQWLNYIGHLGACIPTLFKYFTSEWDDYGHRCRGGNPGYPPPGGSYPPGSGDGPPPYCGGGGPHCPPPCGGPGCSTPEPSSLALTCCGLIGILTAVFGFRKRGACRS